MMLFRKYVSVAASAFVLSGTLAACQKTAPAVTPNAEQQAALKTLRTRCIAASAGQKGRHINFVKMRNKQLYFTCDEMKEFCMTDYAGDMCKGMMLVASVENAFRKACRYNGKISLRSAACSKVTPCNIKGFGSPECAAVIAPYNQ